MSRHPAAAAGKIGPLERIAVRPLWLWMAAVVGGGAVHLALWQVSEPPWIFSDFFKAYWTAAEHVWSLGLNATWPLADKGDWSNLPIFAWLFVPLLVLGDWPAAGAYLGIGYVAVLATWRLLVRLADLDAPTSAGLLFLFLINGPLLNSLREGNSTHFVLLFMVGALAAWRAGRPYAAGVLLGVCALIKPPLLLFGVYFLLRRKWLITAGGATAVAAGGLLSLAVFGVDAHIGWYQDVIEPHLKGYLSGFNVQSIDGFLTRLTTDVANMRDWEPRAPTLAHKIARLCILIALFGSTFWLVRPGDGGPGGGDTAMPGERDYLQFALVLLLALIASPISWTHYYTFLLLPLALYLGGRLPLPDDATTRWLTRGGYVLASLPVVLLAPSEPSWWGTLLTRTVVSAWLFGGLLLFWALARGIRQAAHCPTDSAVIRERSHGG